GAPAGTASEPSPDRGARHDRCRAAPADAAGTRERRAPGRRATAHQPPRSTSSDPRTTCRRRTGAGPARRPPPRPPPRAPAPRPRPAGRAGPRPFPCRQTRTETWRPSELREPAPAARETRGASLLRRRAPEPRCRESSNPLRAGAPKHISLPDPYGEASDKPHDAGGGG